MIGGDDMFIDVRVRRSDIDLILRYLRRAWPEAIVESTPSEGGRAIAAPELFPAKWVDELFIYRDRQSFDSWKQDGLREDNAGAVIYITFEHDSISFVVDDRGSPSGRLVTDIRDAIKENRRQIRRSHGNQRQPEATL